MDKKMIELKIEELEERIAPGRLNVNPPPGSFGIFDTPKGGGDGIGNDPGTGGNEVGHSHIKANSNSAVVFT